MKQDILTRIQELGGTIDQVKGESLQADWQAIEFKHPLYPHELWGSELYGIDDFYSTHKKLYAANKSEFYDNLLAHFFSDHEIPYGQMLYRKNLFTPFKKGTEDFAEWNDLFTDADEVDLSEIYKVTKSKKPDFMQIAYSFGFPDNYYICLSDKNPENPTVFGTDHEVFFSEVTNKGTLEDFLKQFYTKEEFLTLVKQYIETQKADK